MSPPPPPPDLAALVKDDAAAIAAQIGPLLANEQPTAEELVDRVERLAQHDLQGLREATPAEVAEAVLADHRVAGKLDERGDDVLAAIEHLQKLDAARRAIAGDRRRLILGEPVGPVRSDKGADPAT